MIYDYVFPVLLVVYITGKHRVTARVPKGPGEGQVLFPRQDARFAHGAMTALEAVFVLEFISHAHRDEAAFLRLGATLLIFILIDIIYWLKLKNTAVDYDRLGITATDFLGRQRNIPWEAVREVHTSATGVKSARVFTLKTAQGPLRINARSGGLERFRHYMEQRL